MTNAVQVWRFDPTDRIEIDGRFYTWSSTSAHCYSFNAYENPEQSIALSFDKFEEKRALAGFSYRPRYFDSSVAAERERLGSVYFANVSKTRRDKALWRLDYVSRFLALENAGETARSDYKLKEAVKKIFADLTEMHKEKEQRAGALQMPMRTPPKFRTLLEWVVRYEEGGCHPLALVDNVHCCGNRDNRFDAEVLALTARHRSEYCTRSRPTRTLTYRNLTGDVERLNIDRQAQGLGWLPGPSFKAYSNYINELGRFHIYAGRRGMEAAVKRFRGSYGGVSVVRPGQLVEMDEWQVQLYTLVVATGVWEHLSPSQRRAVERERRWVCVALDVATTAIMGMRLAKTSSTENALNTLRMACSDKAAYAAAVGAETPWFATCGIEMLRNDNGGSLINSIFRGAAIDLGITPDIAPAALPQLRAHIERLFGTFDRQLIGRFLGRSFSGISEKGDENPRDFATLTVDELCNVLIRYVVDIYHNTPHGGLNGETPYNAWKRLSKLYQPRMPPDSHAMRAAFGVEIKRKIETRGVRILGNYYNSEWLMKLWHASSERDVTVRMGPDDLGSISVFDGKEKWVTVPCVDEEMQGIQVETWLAAQRDLARRFKDEAELAKPVIMRAVQAITAVQAGANARADIKYGVTSDDINRWERLTLFSFPKKKDIAMPSRSFDLHDDLIIVGQDVEARLSVETDPSTEGMPPAERKRPPKGTRPKDAQSARAELSAKGKRSAKKPTSWSFEDPS